MTATLETTTRQAVTVSAVRLHDALKACLLSVQRRTDRTPILQAVHVKASGGELQLTATDRYRLTRAIVHGAQVEGSFEVIVTATDAARIVAMLKPSPKQPTAYTATVTLTGERVEVVDLDGSRVTTIGLDGQYPRTDSIVDADTVEAVDGVAFNPAQMSDLCKMPGRGKNEPVRLTFAGPHKPMRADWGDVDTVSYRHILMPVRTPQS